MSSPAIAREEVNVADLASAMGRAQYRAAQLARRAKLGTPATPAELLAIRDELASLVELAQVAAGDAEARALVGVR